MGQLDFQGTSSSRGVNLQIAAVVPIFDDWAAVNQLIADLRTVAGEHNWRMHLVVVDDCSPRRTDAAEKLLGSDEGLTIVPVRLVRNCGHQQAIALGLSYAVSKIHADLFVLMDGDGEDRPADIASLIQPLFDDPMLDCVLAKRGRRSDPLRFRVLHAIYKNVAALLTSERIDFGNFCCIRRELAEQLTRMPEALVHIPSTILKARPQQKRVLIDRGTRYFGTSKMNLVSLVIHGLSSVAIFSDRAMARMIMVSSALFLMGVLFSVVAIVLKLAGYATPGWTTTVLGASITIVALMITISLTSLLVVVGNRMASLMTPVDLAPRLIRKVGDVEC